MRDRRTARHTRLRCTYRKTLRQQAATATSLCSCVRYGVLPTITRPECFKRYLGDPTGPHQPSVTGLEGCAL